VTARRIFKNTLAQMVTQGVIKASAFLLGVMAARFWEVGRFGDLQSVLAMAGLFTFVSTLGVNLLLVRELARTREGAHELIGDSLGLVLALSGFCLAGAIAVARWSPFAPDLFWALICAVACVCVMGVNSVLAGATHAAERMEVETFITAIERTVFLASGLVLLIGGLGIVPLLLASLLSHSVGTAGFLWHLARLGGPIRPRWRWPALCVLARRSLPFGVNLILSNIYIQIDVLMLALMVGNVEVGIYAAATSFILPTGMIASTLSRSLQPSFSRFLAPEAEAEGARRAEGMSNKATHWLLLLGIPLSVGLAIVAEQAIVLIYGERYAGAAELVRIMAAVIPLKFLSNSYAMLLTSSDRQGTRTQAVFIAAVLNVGLNLLVIPRWGARGAAAATVVTEVVLFAFLYLAARRLVQRISLLRPALVPLLGSACMAAVLLAVRGWPVVTAIPLGGLVYVALVLAIDRRMLGDLISPTQP